MILKSLLKNYGTRKARTCVEPSLNSENWVFANFDFIGPGPCYSRESKFYKERTYWKFLLKNDKGCQINWAETWGLYTEYMSFFSQFFEKCSGNSQVHQTLMPWTSLFVLNFPNPKKGTNKFLLLTEFSQLITLMSSQSVNHTSRNCSDWNVKAKRNLSFWNQNETLGFTLISEKWQWKLKVLGN